MKSAKTDSFLKWNLTQGGPSFFPWVGPRLREGAVRGSSAQSVNQREAAQDAVVAASVAAAPSPSHVVKKDRRHGCEGARDEKGSTTSSVPEFY
ncbi:unnamed protein product [Sphagnum troendelagicum]